MAEHKAESRQWRPSDAVAMSAFSTGFRHRIYTLVASKIYQLLPKITCCISVQQKFSNKNYLISPASSEVCCIIAINRMNINLLCQPNAYLSFSFVLENLNLSSAKSLPLFYQVFTNYYQIFSFIGFIRVRSSSQTFSSIV